MKFFVLGLAALGLLAQTPQARVRVGVTSKHGPVQNAVVKLNGQTAKTGPDGTAILPAPMGAWKVVVSKEGFLTVTTTLKIDSAKELTLSIEMKPAEEVEEEITVYATRNDVRIQDAPVRVEVLQREEIEEKMLMTPGDIVMMLNEMAA